MKVIIEELSSANNYLKTALVNFDDISSSISTLKSLPSCLADLLSGEVSSIVNNGLTDAKSYLEDAYEYTSDVEGKFSAFENNILTLIIDMKKGLYSNLSDEELKEKLGFYYEIVMSNFNNSRGKSISDFKLTLNPDDYIFTGDYFITSSEARDNAVWYGSIDEDVYNQIKAKYSDLNDIQFIQILKKMSNNDMSNLSSSIDCLLNPYTINNGMVNVTDNVLNTLSRMYNITPYQANVLVYCLAYEAKNGSFEEGEGCASVLLNRTNSHIWVNYEGSANIYSQLTYSGQFDAYRFGNYKMADARSDSNRIEGLLSVLFSERPTNNCLSYHAFHDSDGDHLPETEYFNEQKESDKINEWITPETASIKESITVNNVTEEKSNVYIVQNNDTFFSIALKNNLTLDELKALNPNITNYDIVHPGDKIIISEEEL